MNRQSASILASRDQRLRREAGLATPLSIQPGFEAVGRGSEDGVMKRTEIDILIRMRCQGVSYRNIASALGCTQGAVQYEYQQLCLEVRETMDRMYADAKNKRKRTRHALGKIPTKQGPISRDPEENNRLVNIIFAGRKFESYEMKT